MAKEMLSAKREIISEVIKLIKLILLIPATNASERAASAVRRIKTYLRSTMSQQRLNYCMILHIHKELTDSPSLLDVPVSSFTTKTEERLLANFLQKTC